MITKEKNIVLVKEVCTECGGTVVNDKNECYCTNCGTSKEDMK